jgi:hypothetical protein
MRTTGLRVVFFAAVTLASGCKLKPSDGGADAQTATPTAAGSENAAAAVSAARAAKAKDGGKGDAVDKKQLSEESAALAKGRAATAKKNFGEAISAYDQAVKLAPRDAAAIGERGYVKFLAGNASDAERDLTAARNLPATPKVAGEIWFNLGLVRAQRGDGDGARIAFATSNAISPTGAAAKKLAGLSTCTAEISNTDQNLVKAAGFEQAASIMKVPAAETADAGVKGAVCTQSMSDDGLSDTHDACDSPPPWVVAHAYVDSFHRAHVLFPLTSPAGALWIADAGEEGSSADHCTGAIGTKGEKDTKFGWVTKIYNGAQGVMIEKGGDTKGAVGLVNEGDYSCVDGVGSFDDAFYDLDTGVALLHVRRPVAIGATAPVVNVALKNGVVTISGAGCNQSVDLKLGKFTPDAGK